MKARQDLLETEVRRIGPQSLPRSDAAVLNELAAVARRKLGMTWAEIGDALAAIRVLCPSPALTVETHEAGLRIAAQYQFHIYDALVAASALEAACTTVYSEDLQDRQVIDGRLTIRNPFTM